MKVPSRRWFSCCSFVTAAVAFLGFDSHQARAGSFLLNEQSVSGLGTAYAGAAAQAEDASTIFFNPAGIALLPQGELQGGFHYIIPSATFSNQGSSISAPGTPFNGAKITGGNGGDSGVDHLIPNAYLSQPVFRSPQYGDLTVGIGLSVPFGLETDYDPGWVGRYSALRTKLQTFDIQPTIAYRVFDRISIGASLDIQYASARLSQAVDFGGISANVLNTQFFPALPAAFAASGVPAPFIPGFVRATEQAYANAGFVPQGRDGITELHGDDWSLGFTIGAIFEYLKENEIPCLQEGRIGFSYRSGITHTVRGSVQFSGVPAISASGVFSPLPGVTLPIPAFPAGNALQNTFFNQSATAQLELPEIYHFSIYQRFLHNFAIMGDIELTRWSRLQQIPITFSNPGTPDSVLNLEYKDSYRYAVGLEWYATRQLTLRSGFAYDETPIKNASLRDPRIPDNNRYFLSAGLQYKPLPYLAFDVGYSHLFVPDPQVATNDGQGHILRGKFDAAIDIVSASVTLLWGGPRATSVPETPGKQPVSYRK
jgi:long-chain fatty acid transport protein